MSVYQHPTKEKKGRRNAADFVANNMPGALVSHLDLSTPQVVQISLSITETARLIVSDWRSPKDPVDPIGQDLMYNFIRGMDKAPIKALE